MILIYGDSPVPPETEVTLLPNETRRNHDLAHLEDLALKSAADYFGAELLHWLGIPGKMIRSSPTEIVELETRHMYEIFSLSWRTAPGVTLNSKATPSLRKT